MTQRLLLRALTWSLIGAGYAPLLLMLNALLQLRLGSASLVIAAGASGAIGAAFAGARQMTLPAALVGVAAAGLVLLLPISAARFPILVLLAVTGGLAVGFLVRFPDRCTRRLPANAAIGGLTGVLCGALLAALSAGAGLRLSAPVLVAALVSVNGVLYVAVLAALAPGRRTPVGGRWSDLLEGLVIALVAVVVGASVWGFAGLWTGDPLARVLDERLWDIQTGVIGGLVAGAVTGTLLELFHFRWTEEW